MSVYVVTECFADGSLFVSEWYARRHAVEHVRIAMRDARVLSVTLEAF